MTHIERIIQDARDGQGKAGGDINGTMESHYAFHVANALYLIAEAIAVGFDDLASEAASADPDAPESFGSDESGR